MRLFPAVNTSTANFFLLIAGAFLLAPGSSAVAQDASATLLPQLAPAIGQKTIDRQSFLQGMQAAMQAPGQDANTTADKNQQQAPVDQGSPTDPNSTIYKANQLAGQALQQRSGAAAPGILQNDVIEQLPPIGVEALQRVNETNGGTGNAISDDVISKGISVDMRRDAQREAALSYGARGGLAKRNYQIMERMSGFGPVLDRVFSFRSLLIKAPSGLLIEPPIVKESMDALVITNGGNEAAVADKVFDINKSAKIVSAPRDWREYLVQSWSDVPPPPRVLWPKDSKEQAAWDGWVEQGWKAGFEQAEQIFELDVNRLVADYNGMVRYRMLLEQGMISEPYAMHEDRGVTGNKNQMRVGDRALRITGPSQFLTGAELWKPAGQ